jgi:hypothetical protein
MLRLLFVLFLIFGIFSCNKNNYYLHSYNNIPYYVNNYTNTPSISIKENHLYFSDNYVDSVEFLVSNLTDVQNNLSILIKKNIIENKISSNRLYKNTIDLNERIKKVDINNSKKNVKSSVLNSNQKKQIFKTKGYKGKMIFLAILLLIGAVICGGIVYLISANPLSPDILNWIIGGGVSFGGLILFFKAISLLGDVLNI